MKIFTFWLFLPVLADVDWKSLVDRAPEYGFLGGIVGIVGLMLGATLAILYGWTRAFNDWKPSENSALAGLDKMITALVAVAIIALWLFADSGNVVTYIHLSFWLIGIAIVAFIAYIGLREICTCSRDRIIDNLPSGKERVWGGFWITREAKARKKGVTLCDFLAGHGFNRDKVWPPGSRALAAMATAVVLLLIVAGGGVGLSAAATTAQVALTKKPAREVFSSSQIPGLPPKPTASPEMSRSP